MEKKNKCAFFDVNEDRRREVLGPQCRASVIKAKEASETETRGWCPLQKHLQDRWGLRGSQPASGQQLGLCTLYSGTVQSRTSELRVLPAQATQSPTSHTSNVSHQRLVLIKDHPPKRNLVLPQDDTFLCPHSVPFPDSSSPWASQPPKALQLLKGLQVPQICNKTGMAQRLGKGLPSHSVRTLHISLFPHEDILLPWAHASQKEAVSVDLDRLVEAIGFLGVLVSLHRNLFLSLPLPLPLPLFLSVSCSQKNPKALCVHVCGRGRKGKNKKYNYLLYL